ncbi:MAG: cell division protein ZapA [Firmicutes bacterium]|nr:cell division protein ZapA [Bacillota bacterium]MBR3394423.1 cell division protein ZapA [Bacillota bacterium]
MSERNTVAVKIYGQEYNISGEASREHIMRVADYVDNKMQEIGDAINASNSGVAVLAAVNIADEYFARETDIAELQEKNDQLVSDTQRYSLLWEEAKQSLAQYKEEMAGTRAQQEENLRTLTEKNDRIAELTRQLQEVNGHNEVLRARCEELTRRAESAEAAPEEAQRTIRELEAKSRDIESSFFDIQMENIHLKNELENLRKQMNR